MFGTVTPPEGQDGGDASFAVLHGLYWLTVNASAQAPLVLAIDDLQWVDRASLRFVAYLAHRLEQLPVLVAAAVRTGEPSTDEGLLTQVMSDPLASAIRPGPLSAAAVAELVRAELAANGETGFAEACHEATGGNPLLLRQLLRSLRSEGVEPRARNAGVVRDIGPHAVSRTVLVRLSRLPAEAHAVAGALAVLGDADLTSVAAIAGLDEHVAATATAALARAEILRPDPPLGFVHPLVRDAIYHDVAPGAREIQHGQAARMLLDAGAAPERVAAQLLAAPRRGEAWVVDLLQEAARAATGKGVAESAVAYLGRALEEPPAPERRAGLLLELGIAEATSNGPAAAERLQAAYEQLGDAQLRGRAASVLGRTVLFTEGPERAGEIVRRAAAQLPAEQVDLRQELEAIEHMTVIFAAGSPDRLARLARYRTAAPAPGVGGDMLRALAAYHWMLDCGPSDAVVALALSALESGELIRTGDGLFAPAAINALMYADRPEALECWDAVLAETHVRGSLFAVLTAHLFRGAVLFFHGELAEAEQSLETAVEEIAIWGGYGNDLGSAYHVNYQATAAVERGDTAAAQRLLETLPRATGHSEGANNLRRAWAELHLARGEAEQALAIAEEAEVHASWIPNPATAPWRSHKALALDALGRTSEAIPLAESELALARRWGAPRAVGRALRILGTLRREEGIALLEEAVAVLEPSPAKLERAKALAALGGALRRARRPTDAREPLLRALELAAVCGAQPLVDDVRTELNAAGLRPRATALRGVGSLTASERRVADLAAEGRTNPEIAQALYVTPKTVEVHLTSVYRKLGIRSRREVRAALGA